MEQSNAVANQEVMRALIVEDDIEIAAILKKGLESMGLQSTIEQSGRRGFDRATSEGFDVIILDMMIPELDGFSFLQALRERGDKTPLLILSALRELEDRLRGLKLGGDDYMTKPFSMAELQLRLQNLLKRSVKPSEQTQLNFSDLKLNRLTREVTRGDKKIDLQEREFALLDLLMSHPNKIIGKEMILRKVWNYDFDPQTNIVDVLICRLRTKLDKDFSTRLIYTVRGVGYVLKSVS